jgi:hypothetical protein
MVAALVGRRLALIFAEKTVGSSFCRKAASRDGAWGACTLKGDVVKKGTDRALRRWRTAAVLAVGVSIGVAMIATPAAGHVGGTVNHLWGHLKPKADARYANVVAGTDKANDADKLDGQNSSAFAPAAVEGWHEVGAAGEPAFENSWANYLGGFSTAAFYKDPYGMVHLKGLVQGGTIGTAIFQLPDGYRPALTPIFPVRSNNASGELRIDISCPFFCTESQYVTATSGSNVWFSLDGISFRAET